MSSIEAKISQRKASIRALSRNIALSVPIILGFVAGAIAAYVLDWHPVAKALLTVIVSLQVISLPNYVTRLRDQKRALHELESSNRQR